MDFLTSQLSRSLREKHDKIVFTLQSYFGRTDSLFSSLRITQSVVFTRQTLLKHKYTDNVTDIVSFIVC